MSVSTSAPPYKKPDVVNFKLVTNYHGDGVYLMGGLKNKQNQKTIFELHDSYGKLRWTKVSQVIPNGRASFQAFYLPENMTVCS